MIHTASPPESPSVPALRRPSLQVALSPDDRRFQRLGENHHLWRNGLTEARGRRDEILATVSSEGVLRRVS